MKIIVKNNTLSYDDFIFKCSIGKNGVSTKKVEGDKKSPKGLYSLGPLYFRKDRVSNQ
jgi:L,D-peptidoglycan transpeptidase YkuD (ErfK/YbiS/YcfS/YnhG family)